MSTITFDFRHHYQRGERRESEQIAYQWDLGHVMEVFVPEDATYTIGYCFGDYEKTEDYAIDTKVQDPDGGYKLTAHIPNKYFERSGELRVYVVGSADDHIITTYEGFITIRGRLMPDDYVDDDPENGATQIIEVAREYATKSESFAVGGTGTRLGEDTDNAKYYLEQAEAVAESIPEDYSELSDDVDQLKNALTTKADQDGAYPDLTAGQMLSKNEASDSVPYNFRAVEQEATLEYTDAIVGGSVVKNQLVRNGDFADSSNWAGSGSLSISGGIATYTASGRYDGLYQVFPVTHLKDRVYFMHTKLKTSTATDQIQFILQGAGTACSKYSASTTNWQTLETIGKPGLDFERVTVRDNRADIHDSYQITDIYVIDLTAMLGTTIADYVYSLETATAGAGVAWLRKHFPKMFAYQEYNAGEIVSVQGLSQHITVGFNQWDEEWEVGSINNETGANASSGTNRIRSKNYIPCLPNTEYCLWNGSGIISYLYFYDADKNFIAIGNTLNVNPKVETTPQNCHYVRFRTNDNYGTTYSHDICINLSDPAKNGTYEPYQKRTYPLDDSLTLRGILKLDASNNLYADGDRYLPDGTVQRRYGVVDLGTVDYYKDGDNRFYHRFQGLNMKIPASIADAANAFCTLYQIQPYNSIIGRTIDKILAVTLSSSQPTVFVYDTAYNDTAAFKTAMSGVYLLYELAEPTTETAEPYTNPQIVDPDGTEEYVSTSIVPVGHESRYPLDIAGRLDKILTMPTANGTYTLRATVNNGAVTYAWVST